MTATTPQGAREAPDTPEMKAFAAFLAASFDTKMSGEAMREAVTWALGALPPMPAAAAVARSPWHLRLCDHPAPCSECDRIASLAAPVAVDADKVDAPEGPSPELLRIHDAGRKLSNCAFNLSQRIGDPMTQERAALLRSCQVEWDDACAAFKKARAAAALAQPGGATSHE